MKWRNVVGWMEDLLATPMRSARFCSWSGRRRCLMRPLSVTVTSLRLKFDEESVI